MSHKTETVSVVHLGEAALVDYPEYQRIKSLAENPPPSTNNKGRILFVPRDRAVLVDRTQYDTVEFFPEEPPPLLVTS